VYVHGHEFGGTNPTMIKAMAYGCAILALNTVFNKEMLNNDLYGIYFKKIRKMFDNKSIMQISTLRKLKNYVRIHT